MHPTWPGRIMGLVTGQIHRAGTGACRPLVLWSLLMMNRRTSCWSRVRWLAYGVLVVVATGSLACEGNLQLLQMIFNSSSLGGDIPGRRATTLNVKFVNQTGYRPVFTFGTYDPLNNRPSNDLFFTPIFEQFVIDTTDGHLSLDAYGEQEYTFNRVAVGACGRAISLGGEELIQLIEDDQELLDTAATEALRPLCDEGTDEPVAGIAFFQETSSGPDENACDSSGEIAASAPSMLILQGDPRINLTGDVTYPCDGESTVVITFVEESAGVIRIDVSIEPPAEEE